MPDLPEITDCPYYLISRATWVVTADLRRSLSAAGVPGMRVSYLGALMVLWREDNLKAGDLGRRAGVEPSTMTGLLDRLERDGLVERHPDPKDRRAHRIRLTERGLEARDPTLSAVDSTLDRVLAGVPEHDLERLNTTLRQILTNSDKL